MSEHKKINELIDIKKEKLNKLLENDINPFPHSFNKTHSIEDIIDKEDDINPYYHFHF